MTNLGAYQVDLLESTVDAALQRMGECPEATELNDAVQAVLKGLRPETRTFDEMKRDFLAPEERVDAWATWVGKAGEPRKIKVDGYIMRFPLAEWGSIAKDCVDAVVGPDSFNGDLWIVAREGSRIKVRPVSERPPELDTFEDAVKGLGHWSGARGVAGAIRQVLAVEDVIGAVAFETAMMDIKSKGKVSIPTMKSLVAAVRAEMEDA